MQSLNEVSVELALPPAEPHWLSLPPWAKLLAQATGLAEALLQADIKYRKAATIPGAKPQEPAAVQANKLRLTSSTARQPRYQVLNRKSLPQFKHISSINCAKMPSIKLRPLILQVAA